MSKFCKYEYCKIEIEIIKGKKEREFCCDYCRQRQWKLDKKVALVKVSEKEYKDLLEIKDKYIALSAGLLVKKIKNEIKKPIIPQTDMPVKMIGEDSIDFSIKKREWMQKNK